MNFSVFSQDKTHENRYFLQIKAIFLNKTSISQEISAFFSLNLEFLYKIFDSLKNPIKNTLFPEEKAVFLKDILKKTLMEKKTWVFPQENHQFFKEILIFHHF